MNRREMLAVLGGMPFLGATLLPKAQTTPTVHRIGVLAPGFRPDPADRERLWAPARELGWIVGQNLSVEERYAGGNPALLGALAEELVGLNVEIILTVGTAATIAAKNATTRIPIVIVTAADPVRTGLVASLARPGGNVTGFSMVSTELEGKRLALVRDLLPSAQRVAELVNPANPFYEIARKENEQVYRSLGMQPIIVDVAAASDLQEAVAEAARRGAQALVVPPDGMFYSNRVVIMSAALKHSLPTIVADRELLEAGGLLCLAIDESNASRSLAYFVDKILRGAKPADLPVQQPTKFLLSINLKTAKALGQTIPESLMLRADDIIH